MLLPQPTYTGLGRPRLRVSAAEINRLFDVYRSWKDVAHNMGGSLRTLEKGEINLT